MSFGLTKKTRKVFHNVLIKFFKGTSNLYEINQLHENILKKKKILDQKFLI